MVLQHHPRLVQPLYYQTRSVPIGLHLVSLHRDARLILGLDQQPGRTPGIGRASDRHVLDHHPLCPFTDHQCVTLKITTPDNGRGVQNSIPSESHPLATGNFQRPVDRILARGKMNHRSICRLIQSRLNFPRPGPGFHLNDRPHTPFRLFLRLVGGPVP